MVPRSTLINLIESIGYKCVIVDGTARHFQHSATLQFIYIPNDDEFTDTTIRRILQRSRLNQSQIERFIASNRISK